MRRSTRLPFMLSLCLAMFATQGLCSAVQAQRYIRGAGGGCDSWNLAFSPNPFEEDFLRGVAAVSASDAWAAGNGFDEFGPDDGPIIERWNGSSWNIVDTTLPDEATLTDVSALGADDVWAVGSAFVTTLSPFVAHWDGTSWSSVPVPNPGNLGAALEGVEMLASDDVWAVGWQDGEHFGDDQTLVEHWDGTSWTVVPSPSPSVAQLSDVSGSSSTDVWGRWLGDQPALVPRTDRALGWDAVVDRSQLQAQGRRHSGRGDRDLGDGCVGRRHGRRIQGHPSTLERLGVGRRRRAATASLRAERRWLHARR